jgi:hypothetical protein
MFVDIYEESGRILKTRIVGVDNIMTIQVWLAEFRTECRINKKAYQVDHFINWMRLHKRVTVDIDGSKIYRLDM